MGRIKLWQLNEEKVKALNRQTRKLLTRYYGMMHLNSNIDRLTAVKCVSERGKNMCYGM